MASPDPSPHATIVDEDAFTFVTELEIRKTARIGHALSLLALAPEIAGERQAREVRRLNEQVARAISPVLRATDLIRHSPSSPLLYVLLVDASHDALPVVIQRIMDELSAYLFEIDGERRPVTVSVGGTTLSTATRTADELLSEAGALVEEARRDQTPGSRYRLSKPFP